MNKHNFLLLLMAILAVASMCAIGVSIAEQSWIGGLLSFIGVGFFMGMGFRIKRKAEQ
ncbi:DUF5325 family protein [Bacillus sp. NTK071]|uniref:DUF5325 family protein n=1 Tax=Bacillus sp. NTK071 TaxID=2802175 RepID=UPI001A8E9485|nr:DUF5325 family protein [Bacillus sp. NTK071]MBN8207320.1 DUF5325 family protein [Bacillus sp. NTK071]